MADKLSELEEYRGQCVAYAARVKDFRAAVWATLVEHYPKNNQDRRSPVFHTAWFFPFMDHFTQAERSWINELFANYAKIELLAGFPMSERYRRGLLDAALSGEFLTLLGRELDINVDPSRLKGPTLYADDHKEIMFTKTFFLRPTEPLGPRVRPDPHDRIGKPPPLLLKASPQDILRKRWNEGQYLFGGLPGLMGGAVFYVNYELRGVDFDTAVQAGAVMKTVASIGLTYLTKNVRGQGWSPAAELPSRVGDAAGFRGEDLIQGVEKDTWKGRPFIRLKPTDDAVKQSGEIYVVPTLPTPVHAGERGADYGNLKHFVREAAQAVSSH